MTRSFFHNAAVAVALAAAALLSFSCTKDDGTAEVPEPAEVLGTYEFDGESYDILSAQLDESSDFYYFMFSPLAPGEDISTYLIFGIHYSLADGAEHTIGSGSGLVHNMDYLLVYEDPVHLYSQYRQPQEGVFSVSAPTSDGEFDIHIDALLIDGSPLKLDFSGTFPDAQ